MLPSDKAHTTQPEAAESLLAQIDELDRQLLTLLAKRGDLAFHVAELQLPTSAHALASNFDYARLRQLDEYWKQHIVSKFPRAAAQQLTKAIFGICASIRQPQRIAYLGPPGTFSHGALIQEFGTTPIEVECSTIAGVFSAVERGDADIGVVPIENSIEGSVTYTHDCFLHSPLMISAEFVYDVRLCLAAQSATIIAQIEVVYSHPQPLGQCRVWLSTHLPNAKTVACSSTTVAAQEAAQNPKGAAVTSVFGAELNELKVLQQGIEDVAGNATRFVVISKRDAARTGTDKTSVVFSTPDERGALLRILSIFDAENLNLTRIESRPDKSRRWEYVFFTDIAGHRADTALSRAIERIQSQCQMVQILGSYPRALHGTTTSA